jgi:hypothetical protein
MALTLFFMVMPVFTVLCARYVDVFTQTRIRRRISTPPNLRRRATWSMLL